MACLPLALGAAAPQLHTVLSARENWLAGQAAQPGKGLSQQPAVVIATLALVSRNGWDGHNDGIGWQWWCDGIEQVCQGVLSRLGTLKLIVVDQSL